MLPQPLLDALQVFDGSFESADEAAERVVSFVADGKALDSKTLHVLIATSLRGGWLMGRRGPSEENTAAEREGAPPQGASEG